MYNNYLVDWKEAKQEKTNNKNSYSRSIYTQFLKNLTLDTLDNDVAAFLNEIDTDDIYELELGVHYFVQIVRNQLLSVKELRDEATFSTSKNKLKTSKAGIKQYLKNHIAKLLSNKDFICENTDTLVGDINIEKIANAIEIDIEHYVSDDFHEFMSEREDLGNTTATDVDYLLDNWSDDSERTELQKSRDILVDRYEEYR